jgi:hypothetical protein
MLNWLYDHLIPFFCGFLPTLPQIDLDANREEHIALEDKYVHLSNPPIISYF